MEIEARDAEVMIQGVSGRRMVTLYVHVNDFQERHYTLAEQSMFDFLTGQSEEAAEVRPSGRVREPGRGADVRILSVF